MNTVMEEAAAMAADIAFGKMQAAATRKEVEAVVMEAAMAALRAMRNDEAMVSLEAVAKEAPKVAVRELRDSVIAREAEAEAQMYIHDAAAEETRVAATSVVESGTTVWLLVDGDDTEVEDDDEDEKAEAEAEHDTELRAAEATVRAAAAQRYTEMEARAWQERYDRCHAEDLAEARVKVEATLAAAEAERKVTTAGGEARRRSGCCGAAGRPRWTRPSPTGGTSIRGRLTAAPGLSIAGLCADRTPLSAPRWRRSTPPATATEPPCCRKVAVVATYHRRRPRSHDFPRRRQRLTTGL
jgi:hypothetical protein